jgi:hypothetical protein
MELLGKHIAMGLWMGRLCSAQFHRLSSLDTDIMEGASGIGIT